MIFHIDVNSAFLSWEAVYRLQNGAELDLREIPSAVGGDQSKRRGVILAKSIPAKQFGVQFILKEHRTDFRCPTFRPIAVYQIGKQLLGSGQPETYGLSVAKGFKIAKAAELYPLTHFQRMT